MSHNVHEGFDPVLASVDVVDAHFIKIINAILNFDNEHQTDGDFIELMKDVFSDFIGEWVDEL